MNNIYKNSLVTYILIRQIEFGGSIRKLNKNYYFYNNHYLNNYFIVNYCFANYCMNNYIYNLNKYHNYCIINYIYYVNNYNLKLKNSLFDNMRQSIREDTLEIPGSTKIKKIIPIGNEFFIPEFKIAQCAIENNSSDINTNINTNVEPVLNVFRFGFEISTKPIQKAFKNADESVRKVVKDTAEKIYAEIDGLINNNNKEIKELEAAIRKLRYYLHGPLDCPYNKLNTSPYCLTPEAKETIRKINELREKLSKLKSKNSYSISVKTFKDNFKKISENEIPNVKWPESWPISDELEYLPVLLDEHIQLPKTLKDMNIDSSLTSNISMPKDIEQSLNIPKNIDVDINTIKEQIQWDDLEHSAQQVLTDVSNGILSEIEKYNMCLFTKNSPYTFQIKIEYISDFKKLVELYIYGCLEKAKKAALLVLAGYMPSIINTYGATLSVAISNAIATYWSTLKKCLFDVYNTFKEEVENITETESFDEFLEVIEKYVSIDFELQKRNVPWENKGSLVDLASKVIDM